jgi:hypothetical protein
MENLILKYPKVFRTIDNDYIAIKTDAKVSDLFEVYSDIVHYIDGEIIIILERIIKEKLKEIENY